MIVELSMSSPCGNSSVRGKRPCVSPVSWVNDVTGGSP